MPSASGSVSKYELASVMAVYLDDDLPGRRLHENFRCSTAKRVVNAI